MPTKAVLIVEVQSNGVASVTFEGSERLLIPLVGAVEQVKADLIARAKEKFSFGLVWEKDEVPTKLVVQNEASRDLQPKKYDNYPDCKILPRDKAIDATMYAIEAMNLRIASMRKCPPTQTFAVDQDLLSKL